ncbi:hypothetical protein OAS60_00735 [Candidatus Pelagibacter sp.]|nr:hypothetical protein [Candidatus Pelagibacter sp.]
MKNLIHTLIFLSLSVLISSCAKMQLVELNKDNNTRTIKFTYQNGKSKLVNQKFYSNSNIWIEAICTEKNKKFNKCSSNKIDFTQMGKIQIAQLVNREEQSSSEEQSREEQSSSEEESREEQSSEEQSREEQSREEKEYDPKYK